MTRKDALKIVLEALKPYLPDSKPDSRIAGVLDSLEIVTLLTKVEEELRLDIILDDLSATELRDADSLSAAIAKRQKGEDRLRDA